ncbi:hypothetical protein [Saccharopolyspora thermophila]|uniref:hypothetical protein n=1 Tax=Saccharopolyspora thermophila TaxID=89367 RepID=UPI0031F73257
MADRQPRRASDRGYVVEQPRGWQPYPPQHYPVPPPQPWFVQRKSWQDQAKRVVLTVVAPWLAARFLLKPKTGERVRDRKLTLLSSSRALLAVLVVTLATVDFRQPRDVLADSWSVLKHLWLPAVLLAPVLFVVLLVVTRSGRRRALLPGAPRMLWRLPLGAVCIALSLLVVWACTHETPSVQHGVEITYDENGHRTTTHNEETRNADGTTVTRYEDGRTVISDSDAEGNALTSSIGVLIGFVWFPLFGGCAVYWAARSGLWLGEIHPLLGPIGSVSLTVLIAGQEMAELDAKGVPLVWWLVLLGCGVAGMLVLAAFEFRRARVVGFRIRGGPDPVPQDSAVVRPEAPRRWRRMRGIAAAVGTFFAVVGRGIAKPFARVVPRKRTPAPTTATKTQPGMFAVVVMPWLTARYLFKPEVGSLPRDRLLDRLGFWRTVAGLVVVVATTVGFRGPVDLAWDLTTKGLATIGLAVFITPLPILLALDARRNGNGPQLWQGFVRMVQRAVVALVVAIPLPIGIIIGCVAVLIAVVAAFPTGLLALPLVLLGVLALLWCVPFVVCTFYWAVRTCLWMSEVNPLLAPLAGTVFAVSISIQEFVEGDTKNVPFALWLALNIFGLVTTVLLGIAEYQHARSLGYRLLRLQEPVAASDMSPQQGAGIVRPVLRDLGRLARDHYRYVRETDR